MTSTEQIEFLMGHLGSLGIGVLIAGAIGFLLLKFLLPGYLGEKGKNLATREDIGAITREIEAVKTEYARQLEEVRHELTLSRVSHEKIFDFFTQYFDLFYTQYRACQRAANADAHRAPDGTVTYTDIEYLEQLDTFLSKWLEQEPKLKLWLPADVLALHEEAITVLNNFKHAIEGFRGTDETRAAKEEAFRAIDKVKAKLQQALRNKVLPKEFRDAPRSEVRV